MRSWLLILLATSLHVRAMRLRLERRTLLAAAASTCSCTPLVSQIAHAAAEEVQAKSAAIDVSKRLLLGADLASTTPDSVLDLIAWDAPKRRGLNTEQMGGAVNDGLREREWFVTGRGLPQLFSDDFRFSDPDVSLQGFENYCRQVRRLFDQDTSRCEVVCCAVTAPHTLTVVWRNSGKVNLGPLGVELKPYLVTTTLKTSPADGLIVSQVDDFVADGAGLALYQVPLLRSLTAPAAPRAEELRRRFTTCTPS